MVQALSSSNARTRIQPVPVIRSTRRLDVRGLTSLPVGKVVPIAAFGLLREDQVQSSRLRVNFEMLETVEILMNAVNVQVQAWLVPNLAFDRFDGMDELNRSHQGVVQDDGGTVTPWIQTVAFNAATQPIHTYMGKHAVDGTMVNSAYIEAYNVIWNHRVANRSPDINKRLVTDGSLAKAFWKHSQFAHIVPDFDQAIIDGEVPLNVVDSKLPVTGLVSTSTTGAAAAGTNTHFDAKGALPSGSWLHVSGEGIANKQIGMRYPSAAIPGAANLPMVFAEMAENGITVSLSNIELARKTQAFAALRKQYTGHTDDYIIDLLMNGISVPEQEWRMPMLIADRSTIFGMAKRYSSTADDLTASVVNGATYIDLPLVTPRCPTGGVVMITVEITPEQLFERSADIFLTTTDLQALPEFLRDTLDPEKVEIVQNKYIDMSHASPTATFGYGPMNHAWNALPPMIGGKFFMRTPDAQYDEDRQRIWAVETVNPTLSEDFYLCTNMHMKPFVVQNQDNFECVSRGIVGISGNTVFGNVLMEASDDYEQVMAEAPLDRIEKE